MLPRLVDLEERFEPDNPRDYDPAMLVEYALAGSDYWANLAVGWVEQGVRGDGLEHALIDLENQKIRPQALRHRARRVRKTL
jgi:hypothetical protein